MNIPVERLKRIYEDCPVVSGYGTSVVWCRLPNNTTVRCIGNGDIKYGKVVVAIADNGLKIAFNPFDGRKLIERTEQFLKVRTGIPEEESLVGESTLFAFIYQSFTQVFDVENPITTTYGTALEVWLKDGDNVPILVDTISPSGGVLRYGTQTYNPPHFDGYSVIGFSSYFDNPASEFLSSYEVVCHAIAPGIAWIAIRFYVMLASGGDYAIAPCSAFILYDVAAGEILTKAVSTGQIFSNTGEGHFALTAIEPNAADYKEWLPVSQSFFNDPYLPGSGGDTQGNSYLHYPFDIWILDSYSEVSNADGSGVIYTNTWQNPDNIAGDRVKRPPFGVQLENVQKLVYLEYESPEPVGGSNSVAIIYPSHYNAQNYLTLLGFDSDLIDALEFVEIDYLDLTLKLGDYVHWSYPDRIPFAILNKPGYDRYLAGDDDDPIKRPDSNYPNNEYPENSVFQLVDEACEYYTFTRESDSAGLTVDAEDTYTFVLTQADLDEMNFSGTCYPGDRAKNQTVQAFGGETTDTDLEDGAAIAHTLQDLINGFVPDDVGELLDAGLTTFASATHLTKRRGLIKSDVTDIPFLGISITENYYYFERLAWQKNPPSRSLPSTENG